MGVRSYKDLKVWQAGIRLCVDVYRLTESLPKSEQFGLASQMRRAAASVPANIAEGYQRQHDKELCQFLYISSGSLAEVETYLHLCEQLGYMKRDLLEPVFMRTCETGKMLNGLIAKTHESVR